MKFRFARSSAWGWAIGSLLVLALVAGIVPQAFAILTGSTFEGSDGNLVVNTAGNTDWSNAPNRVRGDDLPSGAADNSFGQGTKEDDPNVTVVTGSIPPQKSDLTRFYVANEQVSNGNIFLYLAWERSNVLGSANMDFEINQKVQPDLTTTGPKTLVRTAGDLLITFDFTNGGGNPELGLLKWVTSGSTSQCFASNALPCWGNRVNLTQAGFAEGAVNAGTVTDPIANVSLDGLEFGEAAINLTGAGVFPAGVCEAFGSAFLKSRSSASFPAEVKDFVAPQPVSISNCPNLSITKTADNALVNAGDQIGFTITVKNDGQGPAQNVTLSDALPTGNGISWSISSINPAGSNCSISGSPQNLNCSGVSIPAGGSLIVHVVSGTTFASCATYPNSATATATSNPPVTASASTTVQCPALTITKTADPNPVSAGTNIGFTITVTNSSAAGTGTAKSVTLSDALPTGNGINWSVTSVNPANANCSISGSPQNLGCNFGDLAPGASASVHVTSPTTFASCATYPNTATAQATNHPSVTASASTTVQCPALTITKTADAASVSAGTNIGFTITVTNGSAAGTGTAKGVTLSDALPTGSGINWSVTSLSPPTASCLISGTPQNLGCNFGDLAPGGSASVHVTSPTAFASCATYPNTATAQATNHPQVQASASTTVQCPALSITKTADPNPVSAGTNIGFTITVTNSSVAGTGTATGVTLSDALPTGSGINWSITQATPTCSISGSPQTLNCSFGDLAPGTSASVHVTTPTTAASCATYSNTATAQATNHPQVQASDSTTVLCPSINISKTADASPISAGDTIGFVITVTNGGPGTASGVQVTDALPSNPGLNWSIDAINSDTGCSITSGTLTCSFGDLDPGASRHVHITSPTTFASCATIPNTASVTTSNDGSGNSTASVVVECPNLAIVKTAASHSVNAGDPIRFAITVSNGGPGIARGVTLNDPLPSGTGVVWSINPAYGGQGTCSINGAVGNQVLSCAIGDMAAGSSVTINLASPTTGQSAGTYLNTATATATNDGSVTSFDTLIVHAFRIVVLVCRQNADNSGYALYASTVIDGDTSASAMTPASVAGLTDAQVCGLDAHFDNKTVGSHGESINIPDNP